MTAQNPDNTNRLRELLADRALQPLAPDEQTELGRLLDENPDVDPWELEWTAALIDLAEIEPKPMPESLRSSVQRDAVAWLAREHGLKISESGAPPATEVDDDPVPVIGTVRRTPWWPLVLAAACVALAALAWWPAPSPSLQYQRLAQVSPPVPWNDLEEAGISGDIVWDNVAQTGVMRFTGLQQNDATKLQYQLWIFDAARGLVSPSGDAFDAVDGGVFDIETVDGAVYVRVEPKLEVFTPTLFAITTEPPGGVVKHIDTGAFRIILTAVPTATPPAAAALPPAPSDG